MADGLSPYIDAAPLEEQKYFLATQQVDEARHAVFFSRFMSEVAGVDGKDVGERLAAIKPRLTWGFRKTFEQLEIMTAELRRKPVDQPRRCDHALPPGHRGDARPAGPALHHELPRAARPAPRVPRGMDNVALDEQRHIGFGVKLLSDLCREDPDCRRRRRRYAARGDPVHGRGARAAGWDRRYTEVFGFTLEEIGAEGAASLETKLRSAGLPMEDLPGPPIFSRAWPAGARQARPAARAGGVLGEKTGPPLRDPRRWRRCSRCWWAAWTGARPSRAGHDPVGLRRRRAWHCRRQRRHSLAPGAADAPTVTISAATRTGPTCWAAAEHPLKLAALRRLRPSGDLRWLWRARRMFPAVPRGVGGSPR